MTSSSDPPRSTASTTPSAAGLPITPDAAVQLAAGNPRGPLAVTHRTGKRRNSPGNPRRFDSIWITPHWRVLTIDHLYDDTIAAGSDHAVVIAELEPAPQGG